MGYRYGSRASIWHVRRPPGKVPSGPVVLDAAGRVIGRGHLLGAAAICWPMPRSRPLTQGPHSVLGTLPIARLSSSRALPDDAAPARVPYPAASSSGRGQASIACGSVWDIPGRSTYLAASRKSSAACTNRNVRGSLTDFHRQKRIADGNRPHGMPYGISGRSSTFQ